VRPLPDGYYLRIWPQPAVPLLQFGGLTLVAAIGGAGIGWLFAPADPFLFRTIALSSVIFVWLLSAIAYGSAFFPVEVVVSGNVINWDGERHALSIVRDCVHAHHRLELRAEGERVLGAIDHVSPAVGRWVSLAIRASLQS
jgi:hypothetical protein